MRLVWIIYVRNLFRGVIAAWYDPMLSRRGLVVVFNGLRECFIRVRSITLLLEHLLVVFLFLEGAWSDTFNFCFRWLLRSFPKWTN